MLGSVQPSLGVIGTGEFSGSLDRRPLPAVAERHSQLGACSQVGQLDSSGVRAFRQHGYTPATAESSSTATTIALSHRFGPRPQGPYATSPASSREAPRSSSVPARSMPSSGPNPHRSQLFHPLGVADHHAGDQGAQGQVEPERWCRGFPLRCDGGVQR